MKAHAILHSARNTVELADVEVRDPGAGELLVEAYYTSISPGTELRCLRGKQPGGTGFPYIPGYALAGRVLKAGPNTSLPEGARVFIDGTQEASVTVQWGGHISHAVVAEAAAVPVPDPVPLLDAAYTKLAAIAFRGYSLAKPIAGERVAVIGLGIVGQISARLFSMSGARTVCCDLSPFRVEKAVAAGVEAHVVTDSVKDTLAAALPEGADIVVDVTGAAPVLAQALALCRDVPWDDSPIPGSRIIVQGSYPDALPIPYQDAFLKEVSIHMPRDCRPQGKKVVLELMAAGKLALADCITAVKAPQDGQSAYDELMDPQAPALTTAFLWKQE